MTAVQRHAVFFSPAPDTAWWEFGAYWLGRDEALDTALPPPALPRIAAKELERITAHPRRYGFHATLKAPFRLREGLGAGDLLARVQALAAARRAIALESLLPVYMDGFVGLVPATRNPALQALADACVQELDDLRAPLDETDLALRGADRLDARGRELIQRFGYPHVLERFRFHLSLTGPVDVALGDRVVAQLARPLTQLNAIAPPRLDRLCIFLEPAPKAPFLRVADVVLPP